MKKIQLAIILSGSLFTNSFCQGNHGPHLLMPVLIGTNPGFNIGSVLDSYKIRYTQNSYFLLVNHEFTVTNNNENNVKFRNFIGLGFGNFLQFQYQIEDDSPFRFRISYPIINYFHISADINTKGHFGIGFEFNPIWFLYRDDLKLTYPKNEE